MKAETRRRLHRLRLWASRAALTLIYGFLAVGAAGVVAVWIAIWPDLF